MVAVLGHRRGGLEALVLQDAERSGEASGGACDGFFEHGGQGAGAQVDDELVAAGGGCQQGSNDRRLVAVGADARAGGGVEGGGGGAGGRSRQLPNDRRLVAVAADARADVAGGGAIEDLQVRDGRARAGEFGVQAFEQRTDYGGGCERGFEAQFALPVQPAQGGFRGGIAGVVDIEEAATGG